MAPAASPIRQVFISCSSKEFGSCRELLRKRLTRPDVKVDVQEDFIPGAHVLLDKLDAYIAPCHVVIHFVGDMTGDWANPADVEYIKKRYPDLGDRLPSLKPAIATGTPRLSYTQWEAYLAVYHEKHLFIAELAATFKREDTYVADPAQRESQRVHLVALQNLGRFPGGTFADVGELENAIYRSGVIEGVARPKPISLPFPSLGKLFKGRDADLEELRTSLRDTGTRRAAIVGKAVHGQGGVGKTRLAVEYAWRYEKDYPAALLFIVAESRLGLSRNIAALAGVDVLDLPEKTMAPESVQAAVIRWLRDHPGWLLILDNVDTAEAADAVEGLFAKLLGGDVLITSRLPNWSSAVTTYELDLLDDDASLAFLLEKTESRRRKTEDDRALALRLARELGNLSLALAQASAFIVTNRLSFAGYLKNLATSRRAVMEWADARLMDGYERSVASTYQTTYVQVNEPARRLLHRLAWLAAESIPEALLEIPVSGQAESEQLEALAELENYSLVTRAQETPSFTVHRLLQDVMRQKLSLAKEAAESGLVEAVEWVAAGLEYPDASEFRSELVPHAVSVLYFLRNDDYRDMAAGELSDQLAQRVIAILLEAGSKSISPQYLAGLLSDYYEVEPLEGALSKFYEQHPDLWAEIEKPLLKENNYVLRYAMARTLAAAYETDHGLMQGIVASLDAPDMNEFERAAYALCGIYEDNPNLIEPRYLEKLADYDAYPGPFAVSNLLISFVADPAKPSEQIKSPRQLVSSPKLWDSHWEFIKLDVWELEAAEDFLAGRPLSGSAGPEIAECYENLASIRDKIGALLSSGQLGERTRQLLTPEHYRSLAHDSSEIRHAMEELAASAQLRDLMWLFFAHPCWSVGEAAAAVLTSLVSADRRHLAIVDELLKDRNWRVQLGANEAAFQLRNIKPELFKDAVHRFHGNHPDAGPFNCKIRGLCAENLISVILSPGRGRRDLIKEFEQEIRFWLRDEDCWVLEHVYRLFEVLHKRRVDFSWLLSDGVSRLFEDSPAWYQLGRAEFLRHIERRKIKLRQA
jgi:hypothetical protein